MLVYLQLCDSASAKTTAYAFSGCWQRQPKILGFFLKKVRVLYIAYFLAHVRTVIISVLVSWSWVKGNDLFSGDYDFQPSDLKSCAALPAWGCFFSPAAKHTGCLIQSVIPLKGLALSLPNFIWLFKSDCNLLSWVWLHQFHLDVFTTNWKTTKLPVELVFDEKSCSMSLDWVWSFTDFTAGYSWLFSLNEKPLVIHDNVSFEWNLKTFDILNPWTKSLSSIKERRKKTSPKCSSLADAFTCSYWWQKIKKLEK